MTNRRNALQHERLRLYLRIVAASAVVGALFGLRLGIDRPGFLLLNIGLGVANGVLIAGSIAGFEIFALRESSPVLRRLVALPFAAVLALKTLAYGAVIAFVVIGSGLLVDAMLPPAPGSLPVNARTTAILIGASLAMTLLFVVVQQAVSLVGRRTFRNLLFGRYRRPRLERRFFLFVDVVGSTALAERFGPLKAHEFLAAVFGATAEAVAACRGEVYQYVGDEIVVTWTEAEGREGGATEARPLRCYFEMRAALEERRAEFEARFGTLPSLRAALHLGEVVAGEVGVLRRAIVYHGDVMNTAARLEGATRELGQLFIASAPAVGALSVPPDLELTDLGALALRGREESIRAYAVALQPS
jgi:adenylate cyclase